MDKTSFGEEVYSVVASIPPGRVLTYGQIAYLIGKPQCSRMVGQLSLIHISTDAVVFILYNIELHCGEINVLYQRFVVLNIFCTQEAVSYTHLKLPLHQVTHQHHQVV